MAYSDMQALAKHVVVRPSDASDPCASCGLGKYISFGYSEGDLYEDDARHDAVAVCLDMARQVMESQDGDMHKFGCGEAVSAGEVKRDLMDLLEADRG